MEKSFMRLLKFGLSVFVLCVFCFVNVSAEPLQFKAKIGFDKDQDAIVSYKFLDNGKKVLIIGQQYLQFWDVENAKLLKSIPHNISSLGNRGFFNSMFLAISRKTDWNKYFVDPSGSLLISTEKTSDEKTTAAMVWDLDTAKQLAILNLPDSISTDDIFVDREKSEIITRGQGDIKSVFAIWDSQTYKLKSSISIDNYYWHQFIRNNEKIVVGSGDTKILWNTTGKNGLNLTLRDLKTGAVEKEFTADGLLPKTPFLEIRVSKDEKFLISIRDKRIFVWDIDGSTKPKFELSAKNPNEKVKFVDLIDRNLIVSVDKKLVVYDVAGDGKPKYELISDKSNDSVKLIEKTTDGRFIVVSDDIKFSVIETAGTGKPAFEIDRNGNSEKVVDVRFMSDENYIVVRRVNKTDKSLKRTEFYDIETGKLKLDFPAMLGYNPEFHGGQKYLISSGFYDKFFSIDNGYETAFVWNLETKTFFTVRLKHYTPPSQTPEEKVFQSGYDDSIKPVEFLSISPDQKIILKYGGDLVTIFDIETGKEIQTIFNPEKVKYDKENKVKKSGLNDAGWSADGKYIYAFGFRGFFGYRETMSLWSVNRK
jgi:WD40 repeat protein